jgi:hypothetical protein
MNQPQKPGSEKAVILSIDIARGTGINLSSMAAVEARNKAKENGEMEGLITIQFETCKGTGWGSSDQWMKTKC